MSFELPRRPQRSPVVFPVQRRTNSGLRDNGQISDISTLGCCIRTHSASLRVGARVVIRPDAIEALGGIVRWTAADYAGVEFDRPICDPVIGHLAQLHSQGQPVALLRG